MTNKELEEKLEAQKKHCKDNDLPDFAPSDGYCWSCGHQIYEAISLQRAQTELITGCPFCHRSYCD